KNYKQAYHIDCYRIKKADELLKLGLREVLENPQNIVLIEWAEKIKKILPKNFVWLKFEHGPKENIRVIRLNS
ncbi:MAG: tRNA (adenosine(37)-N6)-threonylcarbamoyltransferase complex ATPase subunit type 1 TsaE, partial [Parcubacteria group bacterium]|nr:tRNA (adenosine(37)-N6)-threonylcarbamoyltransferase complex ATPase subunit type 1 TsaE [Parcubacteria group bacterium]